MNGRESCDSQVIESIWNNIGELLTDRVVIEDRVFKLQRPRNADHLRNEAGLRALIGDDAYLPYWTDLWPAARMLAKTVLREPWQQGTNALEIGCGLGLPGIAALASGLHVTFSDYDPLALRFAEHNARLNDFNDFGLLQLDWCKPPSDLRFPVVLASDVIYELKHVEPLITLIKRMLQPDGLCLLTDQDRVPSQALRQTLASSGLSFTTQLMRAGEPGGRRVKGTLYRICGERRG